MRSPKFPEVEMKRIERAGVMIDYCPKSGGVWLDKGELEKLIEAYNTYEDSGEDLPLQNLDKRKKYHDYEDDDKDDYYHNKHSHKKKKESFLSEIFDIF